MSARRKERSAPSCSPSRSSWDLARRKRREKSTHIKGIISSKSALLRSERAGHGAAAGAVDGWAGENEAEQVILDEILKGEGLEVL
jgi:hypothetical protein